MAYLIIGIDPGHTVGVAALDFSGRLVHAAHLEGGGMAGAVSLIESWGTPSLIATDVRPAPEMALKLAAAFNVPLFVPQRPWREDDKKEALRQMVEKAVRAGLSSPGARSSSIAENAHERDAIAAAVAAWRAEQNLLRKADGENLAPPHKQRLQHLLLQGFRHDFALQKIAEESQPASPYALRPGAPPSAMANAPSTDSHTERRQPAGRHELSAPAPALALERQNAELRKRIGWLESEREGLQQRIAQLEDAGRARLSRDFAVRKLQATVERLQKSLQQAHAKLSAKNQRPKNEHRPSGEKKNRPADRPHAAHSVHSSSARPPPAASSSAAERPPSLKETDAPSVLEKLVREYRRNRG